MVPFFFDLVFEEIQEVSELLNLEKGSLQTIDDLTYYFQKTYIKGETIERYTKEAQYPLAALNHSRDVFEGLVSTRNAVEGWHRGLKTYFQGTYPCIRPFSQRYKREYQCH